MHTLELVTDFIPLLSSRLTKGNVTVALLSFWHKGLRRKKKIAVQSSKMTSYTWQDSAGLAVGCKVVGVS